jgi:hypothetical protein
MSVVTLHPASDVHPYTGSGLFAEDASICRDLPHCMTS